MNKDKEYLQRNYMKLKSIRRDLFMMTVAPLPGETHYEILKPVMPRIEEAIKIMKKLIEEG